LHKFVQSFELHKFEWNGICSFRKNILWNRILVVLAK
jgi:hypothetical protein